MNCEDARVRLPDYWSHALDDAVELEMEAHLATCDACRQEAQDLGTLWQQLALIPAEQPSPALRGRFYETLAAYKQGLTEQPKHGFSEWLARWWPARPALQFALSAALLVIGVGVGYGIRPAQAQPQPSPDVAQLRAEVSNMRQLVALSLLQQQSASERLKGVTWSYRVEPSDTQVLSALLYTVNHDTNVNVRLSAVDALHYFADSPVTRKGIAQSIAKQSTPLVQIALIDLLVELRERQAVPALQALAVDQNAYPEVRERAKWAVERLR